ncbi:MAG: bifunctional DNA-formamidopyrimidine glycosylase/DNA-(apurinic or apyrimidinic site) lyase [bacterium]|nr:bifunctional DNA-formamidopyrimidine glycosylase/DNA-(apurinic or apyrimidinic site) lyase [bacterium]
MPELPEVETIRQDLLPLLVGKRLQTPFRHIVDPHHRNLERAAGDRILGLSRRGKYLLADLGARELVIHLGMTGQLAVQAAPPSTFRHPCVSWPLDDGSVLWFNDQRRFGWLVVVDRGDHTSIPTLHRMGPEPLGADFDLESFATAVARVRGIKAALLSQRLVAGVGNIYADEALHLARLHPGRGALDRHEAERLHAAIRQVLGHGILHRGTTFKDYRDGMGRYGGNQAFLRVFDRTGEPCPVCQTPIVKIRVAQRGSHLCPTCQSPGA